MKTFLYKILHIFRGGLSFLEQREVFKKQKKRHALFYKKPILKEENQKPEDAFLLRADEAKNLSSSSYYSYLIKIARQRRFYEITRRTGNFFSPLFFIYRVFRWGLIFLTWIETSAVLLLFFVIVAAVLPPLLVLFLSFLYGNIREDRRYADRLLKLIGSRDTVVLTGDNAYSPSGLVPRASSNVCFLLVVNNFSSYFRHKKRFFLPMSKASENVFYIRESLYFQIRDRLLQRDRVMVIH